MDYINLHVAMSRDRLGVASPMLLDSGLMLSIQASRFHYSTPRSDVGPYTHFEVAVNSDDIPEELLPYENGGIYVRVPVEVLFRIVYNHGGVWEPPT